MIRDVAAGSWRRREGARPRDDEEEVESGFLARGGRERGGFGRMGIFEEGGVFSGVEGVWGGGTRRRFLEEVELGIRDLSEQECWRFLFFSKFNPQKARKPV